MKKSTLLLAFCLTALSSTAQLQDPGFENWATNSQGRHYLTDWEHLVANTETDNVSLFGTYRDTIPASGTYALKVSRWYNYTWDRVRQTKPINFRPASLSGQYRYTDNELMGPNLLDTALVQVFLTRLNTSTGQPDTIGSGQIELGASAMFSDFNCPISYSSSQVPEKISVIIWPTKWINGGAQCPNGWGCFLTIDDLALTTLSSSSDPDLSTGISLYPNPARNSVTITLDSETNKQATLQLLDVQGRLFGQKTVPAQGKRQVELPLNNVPSGMYSVQVVTGEKVQMQKLLVE